MLDTKCDLSMYKVSPISVQAMAITNTPLVFNSGISMLVKVIFIIWKASLVGSSWCQREIISPICHGDRGGD
jgi:hypothetical protein